MMRNLTATMVAFMAVGVFSPAWAINDLQLYIEGSTYDTATETWVLTTDSASFEIWVIGQSPVYDVKLSVAVMSGDIDSPADLSITGTTTGDTNFTDPSTAANPILNAQHYADGVVPLLGDGSALPPHGVSYGTLTWFEYRLGDFSLTDSPIADFMGTFPTPTNQDGQINAYTVTLNTAGPISLHFDAYNHVFTGNGNGGNIKYVNAPFSHDAGGSGDNGGGGETTAPEPTTIAAALMGLIPAGYAWRRRRQTV